MSTFRLSDYDCIGFDLDNTLLRYNVTNMVLLEYDVISKFLIQEKNYSPKYLGLPLGDKEFDFLQKGLILDLEKGNILRIAADGLIKQASHGTRKLTLEEIRAIYPDQHWHVSDIFAKDMLETWNGPLSLEIRAIVDYFDVSFSLVFARIVDTLDEDNAGPVGTYNIWPDILEGAQDMFDRENFALNKGQYFNSLKANPEKYLHVCHPEIITWIKKLRQRSKIFLLTGSAADFANFTASYTLGEDWRSLFDVVVCYAKKPGFFTGEKPFYELDSFEETKTIQGGDLKLGGIYSQGNWRELVGFVSRVSGVERPKCLYFGDNLIQDIYVPHAYVNCDTIAIVDEQLSEKMLHHDLSHSDEEIINSEYWGSYFCLRGEDGECEDSLWCHVIRSHTKLCIPQLDCLIGNPLDKEYECFGGKDGKSHGFYPGKPLTAL